MSRSDPLTEMRRICLTLPETAETMTWGQPHFRVRGKIFAGFGDHGGTFTIGFKLEREHADAAIQDPRFVRAPYVGAHGWISMDVKGVRDWAEVRALVRESYRLIAPKKLWAAVLEEAPAIPARRTPRSRSSTPSPRGKKRTAPRARRGVRHL